MNKDQRLTVRALEANLGAPNTTVPKISSQDLGMKCVMTKLVLQLLLPEQKEHRAAVTNDTGRTVRGLKEPTLKGSEAP